MKKIFVIVFTAGCFMHLNAQFTHDYLRAADDYFKKENYFSAAQYYEKYLNPGKGKKKNNNVYNPYAPHQSSKKSAGVVSSREQAVYSLAESYRKLNYHVKAEPFYKEVVETFNDKFPLARYHYAATFRALGKYEEAEKEFIAFLDQYTSNDTYRESAEREIQNLRFIREQLNKKDINLYTVNKEAEGLNTKGANYAPVWLDANTLLFTSSRSDSAAGKNEVHNNRVYQAVYNNGITGNIQKIDLPQPKDIHQGVISLTPDGNTIFLSRWTIGDGKKTAAIYSSKKSNGKWSEPIMLDEAINVQGYNTQQPLVMPDGKYLIFSSDRPGGQGGYDLWYAVLDGSGNAGKPVNMGNTINTKFDEQAPYYHAASGTLVFSGNGRVGMGGYDFFYSKGNTGNWNKPENFGYPVNSVKDDIYFSSRGGSKNILEDILFSSDRLAECCLEMYSLKKIIPARQISGLVVDCETNNPILGATVTIADTINKKIVYNKTTGADGGYSLTLPDYQLLKLTAAAEGYYVASLHFNMPTDEGSLELRNPILCLARIPEIGTKEVLENVYYEFNKAVILEESHAALNKLFELLEQNPSLVIEIGGHTDSRGADDYNQKLSEARAKSVVDYLVGKGLATERLKAVGYGESQPIAPNQNPDGSDNAEGRKQNRRTEFKILDK